MHIKHTPAISHKVLTTRQKQKEKKNKNSSTFRYILYYTIFSIVIFVGDVQQNGKYILPRKSLCEYATLSHFGNINIIVLYVYCRYIYSFEFNHKKIYISINWQQCVQSCISAIYFLLFFTNILNFNFFMIKFEAHL